MTLGAYSWLELIFWLWDRTFGEIPGWVLKPIGAALAALVLAAFAWSLLSDWRGRKGRDPAPPGETAPAVDPDE